MDNAGEPKLAPPGAGIPWPQIMVLRYYYKPFVAARSDWDENWQTFDRYNQKIQRVVGPLSAARMTERVLVPPMTAIEDSSRFWSASMVLEHLVICGDGMAGIIKLLGNGKVPARDVGTAEVKPHGRQTAAESLAAFQRMAETTRADVEGAVRLPVDRTLKANHPWMRAFDALQWQWVLGAHTAVHYRQLKEIIKRLPIV